MVYPPQMQLILKLNKQEKFRTWLEATKVGRIDTSCAIIIVDLV